MRIYDPRSRSTDVDNITTMALLKFNNGADDDECPVTVNNVLTSVVKYLIT